MITPLFLWNYQKDKYSVFRQKFRVIQHSLDGKALEPSLNISYIKELGLTSKHQEKPDQPLVKL